MIDIKSISEESKIRIFNEFVSKLNTIYDLEIISKTKFERLVELIYINNRLPFSEACKLINIPRTTMHNYYKKLRDKKLLIIDSTLNNDKGRPLIIIEFIEEVKKLM